MLEVHPSGADDRLDNSVPKLFLGGTGDGREVVRRADQHQETEESMHWANEHTTDEMVPGKASFTGLYVERKLITKIPWWSVFIIKLALFTCGCKSRSLI